MRDSAGFSAMERLRRPVHARAGLPGGAGRERNDAPFALGSLASGAGREYVGAWVGGNSGAPFLRASSGRLIDDLRELITCRLPSLVQAWYPLTGTAPPRITAASFARWPRGGIGLLFMSQTRMNASSTGISRIRPGRGWWCTRRGASPTPPRR